MTASYRGGLTEIRLRAGLSRDRLAAMSGVSPSTIYRLEVGKVQPNLGTLVLLAAALGVTPGDLDPGPPSELTSRA